VLNFSNYSHAATRVLNCINQMFLAYFWQTNLAEFFPKGDAYDRPKDAVHNACVDSTLTSIRSFGHFLDGKGRKDDLMASMFPGFIPPPTQLDPKEREKINKKVAHMTLRDLEDEVHPYAYENSLRQLIPAAIAFCNYVCTKNWASNNLKQFAEDTKQICQLLQKTYLSRFSPDNPPDI
jgi:hypothetical protein